MTRKEERETACVPGPALVALIHAKRGQMSLRQRVDGARAVATRARSRGAAAATWALRTMAAATFLLAVGLVGAGIFAWDRHGSAALSYAIENGNVERGGIIQTSSAERTKVRFSDGSELLFSPDAKAALRSIDNRGARVSLADGIAHVDIVHQPKARWLVDAGPFLITVTGTAFTVGYNVDDEQLDVDMERGSVEVSGPLSDDIVLRSGQHLIVRVRERETLIRDSEDKADAGAKGSSAVEPPATETAPGAEASALGSAPPPASPTIRKPRAAAAGRNWATALANGDFETVVAQAEELGIDTCLNEANSIDLAALADAARYRRHDEIARRALLALRRRFPLTGRARDASFLLGRLDETQSNARGALGWYDIYLGEAPGGNYASEALGRKMNLTQQLSGDARAQAVAEDYLSRFPEGTYAARARVLTHAQ